MKRWTEDHTFLLCALIACLVMALAAN